MKKLISLVISAVMLLSCANIALAAEGDISVTANGDAIECTFFDGFDGVAGEYVGGEWSNGTVKGDGAPAIANLSYKYATDPKNANNSVFEMKKVDSAAGDKDLRINTADFNSSSYVREDMTIAFRYYNYDGYTQLNIRNYDGSGEGAIMTGGSINLYAIEGLPEDGWCDIRIEIDMRSENKYVVNGYVTVTGTTTQFLAGEEGTLTKGADGGVSEIDINCRYKSSGTAFIGTDYIDDFAVYINRGKAVTVNSVKFADENGSDATTPQEKGVVSAVDVSVINGAALPSETKLLVAVFDGNTLSDCAIVPVSGTNTYNIAKTLSTKETSVVKVFCLNMQTLIPMIDNPFDTSIE